MQADQYTRFLQRENLKIIVLGPGQAQPSDLSKRQQIAVRLRARGYTLTMLGEELLEDAEAPFHLALRSEIPRIDLLLVLNTGVAPLVELTTISLDYRARQITRVWSKRAYREGHRTTPGDVLGMFINSLFSEEEFNSCELVESVVATADQFCMSKAQLEGRLSNLGLPPPN